MQLEITTPKMTNLCFLLDVVVNAEYKIPWVGTDTLEYDDCFPLMCALLWDCGLYASCLLTVNG